jgi:hypothetical protein
MTVWQYLANSLAWSGVGLFAGMTLGQIGWGITVRHSGRRQDDDT